jgi:hypothetical protein
VESSCEFGIEPSGSIKRWETIECPNNWEIEEDEMGGACSTNGEEEEHV